VNVTRPARAVIVGSGLAGLTCARDLGRRGWRVTVLTPGRAGRDGASHRVHSLAPWILLCAPWVRGDSPAKFLADLRRRGGGRERPGLAEVLVEEAHRAAVELCSELELVTLDDRPALLSGDAVPRGRRVVPRHRLPLLLPLLHECAAAGVQVVERAVTIGLATSGDRVTGVTSFLRESERPVSLAADAVVLACGGVGAVFPMTTVPRWCRGSAIALASSCGVSLHAPHLTQALPVTATPPLYFPTTAALLAGRIVVDGSPFGGDADLMVATRVMAEAFRRGAGVALDPTGAAESLLPPKVRESATFQREGRVPLALAVHHGVGGVAIDSWCRTSMPGLYACGEAAGGVQGARRTMGTGLLEARVFGQRAAAAVAKDHHRLGRAAEPVAEHLIACPAEPAALEARIDALAGPLTVIRPTGELLEALAELERWPLAAGPATERGYLAGIRRSSAMEIVSSALADPEAGCGPALGDGADRADRRGEGS
jgi:aspartate oxidase